MVSVVSETTVDRAERHKISWRGGVRVTPETPRLLEGPFRLQGTLGANHNWILREFFHDEPMLQVPSGIEAATEHIKTHLTCTSALDLSEYYVVPPDGENVALGSWMYLRKSAIRDSDDAYVACNL